MNTVSPAPTRRRNLIGRRLVILVVLFSSAIALLVTLLQLSLQYNSLRNDMDVELDQLQIYVPSIAASVWDYDIQRAQASLDSLAHLPNIAMVRLTAKSGSRVLTAGNLRANGSFIRTYSLVHQDSGREEVIGKLEIIASLDAIYSRLLQEAISILIANTLKTILVATFMLVTFNRLVTRRVRALADDADRLAPRLFQSTALSGPAQDNGPPGDADEIDVVKWSFDAMATTLGRAVESMQQSNLELQNYKNDLERLVSEKTSEVVRQKNEIAAAYAELSAANELLVELATTDQLTGLYNRRKLNDVLQHEVQRLHRTNQPFSLIICDIDKFKDVNDNYGHQVGDQVLTEVAGILRNSVRQTDAVGRWGGEEFVVVCPTTPLAEACLVAEKIRSCVEEHKFQTVGQKTCSFGVAQCGPDDALDDVIARADAGLYRAKASGRNQVVGESRA